MSFSFLGQIPPSKSLLNRALVVASYFPDLRIQGDSRADDVQLMRAGLASLMSGQEIQCGHAGTVLRFLALRAAREEGQHVFVGSERLFSRPMDELLKILRQLGCEVELTRKLVIRSWGWKMAGDALHVPADRSSQFATSVVLNSWKLPFPVFAFLGATIASSSYFHMTCKMAEYFGMKLDRWGADLRIPASQQIKTLEYIPEPDMSSAFALAAVAAVSGQVHFKNFPTISWQPDFAFIECLRALGVPVSLHGDTLKVDRADHLRAIQRNLGQTPDLFPVLAALCALAPGESHLFGARQLVYKESNRLKQTALLLRLIGRECVAMEDGLRIHGSEKRELPSPVKFDPDEDHRMAMAAAVLQKAGLPIEIMNQEVLNKSFPEFSEWVGGLN